MSARAEQDALDQSLRLRCAVRAQGDEGVRPRDSRDTVFACTERLEVDLMVMGGYGHSRCARCCSVG
jgi:hypothetical protein